jgi:hypothetical protein
LRAWVEKTVGRLAKRELEAWMELPDVEDLV